MRTGLAPRWWGFASRASGYWSRARDRGGQTHAREQEACVIRGEASRRLLGDFAKGQRRRLGTDGRLASDQSPGG